jgi:long-chain fatty acid transport protein
MPSRMNRMNSSALLGTALLALVPAASAEGFRSPTLGAQGLGLSGGRRAFIDDASAAWHQPSNLTDLARWEAAVEPTFVNHRVEFTSGVGLGTASTVDPWKFLPSVFAGGPISKDWSAGLAITAPYGLGINWDRNGAFRYTAPYETSLQTINVGPSVAYTVSDHLSISAGLDVLWGELKFRQLVPWGLLSGGLPFPDGEVAASGDGVAFGGNLSATWKVDDRTRVAVGARLPTELNVDGRLNASQVPLAGDLGFDFGSALDLPTTVTLGLGHRCSDRFTVQADAEWVQFSRFKTLPIRAATPPGITLPGLADVPENWRDTFTAGLTGEWRLDGGWRLRGGYQYFMTPVPDQTMSPLIPDANQHVATVGVSWRSGNHRLDASYAHVFYDDRAIAANQNPAYIGRYSLDVHLLSAAYGYAF